MPIIPPQSWTTRVMLAVDLQVVEQSLEVVDPAVERVIVSRVVGLVREAAADVVGNDRPVRAGESASTSCR